LSQAVSGLPVKVFKPGDTLLETSPIAHSIINLLGVRPSAEWSAFAFRETMMRWALVHGNGYSEIERDQVGRVIGLYPIHPERVIPYRHDDGSLYFRVFNGASYLTSVTQAGFVDMEPKDLFHLKGWGDGPVGVNVIDYMSQAIGWAQAAEIFGAEFFGSGMNLSGVVQLKGRGDEAGIERMRSEMERRHAKRLGGRSHSWAFLDNDATIAKIGATPDEGQFVATLNYHVEMICRVFGVPPAKVQHLIRGTLTSIESQNIEVVVDAIVPWVARFEQEASFKLFGQNRQNLIVELDLKGLLRGDFKTRQEGFEVMRRNGVISADDWAEQEGLKKPGNSQGGDEYLLINVWSRMADVASGVVQTSGAAPGKPQEPIPGNRAQLAADSRNRARLARAFPDLLPPPGR